jgi:hypothetical protein
MMPGKKVSGRSLLGASKVDNVELKGPACQDWAVRSAQSR